MRNNQMPNKTSLFEFNYELKYAMQNRKNEQDLWNICWTDSVLAVDFCREMRRFQKINVSFESAAAVEFIINFLHSIFLGCSSFAEKICWQETLTEC